MSTVSEVDIRDWEKVDFKPFQPDEQGRYKMVDYDKVIDFVKQVEEVRRKQVKQLAKLLGG